jgi:hypothetical protein
VCVQYATGSQSSDIHIHTYICEGKDEAMASGGVIFQSVAGTGSRSYILK